MKRILFSLFITAIAGTAFAHGAATGIVRERMDGMVLLAKTMKSLAAMTKSDQKLNLLAIQAAGQTIADHAGKNLTTLFPTGSTQHSDATPLVWSHSDEFQRLADRLASQGMELRGIDTPAQLQTQIKQIAETCSACHADYRQKKE
jgi:cytochrome c556